MKDPAFLFYPGDYLSMTMGMSRIERDCFTQLWLLQFNCWSFTEDQAKNELNEDYEEVWPVIRDKFKEENGKYYNEYLRDKIIKRMNYCRSRKQNIESYYEKKGKKGTDKGKAKAINNKKQIKMELNKKKEEPKTRIPAQRAKTFKPEMIRNGVLDIWERMSPDAKKEYKREVWNCFFLDNTWMEETCRALNADKKYIEAKLKDFLNTQAASEDINTGVKALKRHFINKVKKEKTTVH